MGRPWCGQRLVVVVEMLMRGRVFVFIKDDRRGQLAK